MANRPKIEKVSETVVRLGPVGHPKVLCSYLIVDQKVSIVDCGPSSVINELFELVHEWGLSPGEIDNLFLTHIHIDHAGGVAEFLERCPTARVYVPIRGFKHLVDPSSLNPSARAILGPILFDSWGPARPIPETKVQPISNNEKIDLGREDLRYIECRGHAPHHDVLFLEKSKNLFAADALGIYDDEINELHSPTTPPPSFNFDRQLNDFATIQNLAPDILCLAHFRSLSPSKEFYDSTLKLYLSWGRIIGGYLSERNIAGIDLKDADVDELFSRFVIEYPSYTGLSERMEYQIKRVDIRGFAQWFDYKSGSKDSDRAVSLQSLDQSPAGL